MHKSFFCFKVHIIIGMNLTGPQLILVHVMLLSSSQDTVIAMRALARFSEETYSSQLNKTITFDVEGLAADPVAITDENRFERTEYEVRGYWLLFELSIFMLTFL